MDCVSNLLLDPDTVLCPNHHGGSTGRVWESDMGFDTGSSALQIFSFEILQLVRDFRVCSSNQCSLSD